MFLLQTAGTQSNDPKYHSEVTTNRTKAAQIYAARDIVEEDDHDEGRDDQEDAPVEDNEEPYSGSQYTSKGEEMVFDRLQGWGSSNEELPLIELHARNMEWDNSSGYAVLDEDCLKCLEDRELWEVETDSSSSDDKGFPLFMEVSESEEEEIEYQSDGSEEQGETLEDTSESDYADINTDSESEDKMVYEVEVLISAMRSGVGSSSPTTKMTTVAQPVKLCKSSKLLK